jgi:hypothetical protein
MKKKKRNSPPLWDSSVPMHRSPTAAGVQTDSAKIDNRILDIFGRMKKRKGLGRASRKEFVRQVLKLGIGAKEAKVNFDD